MTRELGIEVTKAIHEAIEFKRQKTSAPFPLTRYEMIRIRKAIEKRHYKAKKFNSIQHDRRP